MSLENILAIKNDIEFLKQATEFLEGMPYGIKKSRVKKFTNNGKGSWKMLYLSLAHGEFSKQIYHEYRYRYTYINVCSL
jgi:hypothetical protein